MYFSPLLRETLMLWRHMVDCLGEWIIWLLYFSWVEGGNFLWHNHTVTTTNTAWPIINVMSIVNHSKTKCIKYYRSYNGRTPLIVTSDAESIKEITIKQFQKFTNRQDFTVSDPSLFFKYAINLVKDDHWKHLRASITPTFTSGKLKKVGTNLIS